MIAVKIVMRISGWTKPCEGLQRMPSRMQVFLLPANFELDGVMSHKHGLASKYSFKMAASEVEFWASFETNFFRIAGTLEAETSVSGKTHCQCLLVIGEDKKVSFLE